MAENTPNDADDTVVQSLYVKEAKVYPREVSGRFHRLRTIAAWVLLGLFYVVAWIQVDGQQVLLFDLPAREFHIFGLTLWPQDFFLLTLLLAMAAVSLFFFTALAGRLWCGYACPQTVWTEVFVALERFTEGRRNQRIKLDKGPWTAEKVRRKLSKQVLWVGFALWTGFTFVGYFTPIRELAVKVATLNTGGWETFWILFYGLATYGNAGFLREQVCKYMCPYARFQSAMFDRDTLIVSYDQQRGEPRGARPKKASRAEIALGDCIDCQGCVQVCPTGIDIRQGLQYECISCGLCADVCNQVMDKMGYPQGLIRYTSENAVAGKPVRVLRPRIFVYGAILLALFSLWLSILVGRENLSLDVLRDRNALYRVNAEQIENAYTLKIGNRTDQPMMIRFQADGMPGLRVLHPTNALTVPPQTVIDHRMTLGVAKDNAPTGLTPISVTAQDAENDGTTIEVESRFFYPGEASRRSGP
jgi:cytochrome c oxidase accessory protein FixG